MSKNVGGLGGKHVEGRYHGIQRPPSPTLTLGKAECIHPMNKGSIDYTTTCTTPMGAKVHSIASAMSKTHPLVAL